MGLNAANKFICTGLITETAIFQAFVIVTFIFYFMSVENWGNKVAKAEKALRAGRAQHARGRRLLQSSQAPHFTDNKLRLREVK